MAYPTIEQLELQINHSSRYGLIVTLGFVIILYYILPIISITVCTYFILKTSIQQQKHFSCVIVSFVSLLLRTVFFLKHSGQVKKYFGEDKNLLAEIFLLSAYQTCASFTSML